MSYEFEERTTATIKAKLAGTTENINVAGTNPTSSPSNAKTQIDKLLAVVNGGSVAIEGMTRIQVSEVISDE